MLTSAGSSGVLQVCFAWPLSAMSPISRVTFSVEGGSWPERLNSDEEGSLSRDPFSLAFNESQGLL